MLSKHFSALACGLTLSLGGCAAAPLAHMAVTHMAAPQAGAPQGAADAVHTMAGAGTPQAKPAGAQAGDAVPSFSDISHGISGSFHKLIGDGSATQTLVTGSPGK